MLKIWFLRLVRVYLQGHLTWGQPCWPFLATPKHFFNVRVYFIIVYVCCFVANSRLQFGRSRTSRSISAMTLVGYGVPFSCTSRRELERLFSASAFLCVCLSPASACIYLAPACLQHRWRPLIVDTVVPVRSAAVGSSICDTWLNLCFGRL